MDDNILVLKLVVLALVGFVPYCAYLAGVHAEMEIRHFHQGGAYKRGKGPDGNRRWVYECLYLVSSVLVVASITWVFWGTITTHFQVKSIVPCFVCVNMLTLQYIRSCGEKRAWQMELERDMGYE